LLAALIGWMYHVIAHHPGGQPIGALEWAASRSWRFVKGLIPRRAEGL
jgi:lipopolysaccharide export system permease protein